MSADDILPPRKRNWKKGNYQIGVFVRFPDGAVFQGSKDDLTEAEGKEFLEAALTALKVPREAAVEAAKKVLLEADEKSRPPDK
jgi:hypothetical protein